MTKSLSPHLLSPFDLRGLVLRNRVIMAPLTRARAGRERVPNALMAEYYLSNPDLVERFANGWALNPPADMKVWSAPTAQGYTDFPFHPQGQSR